MGIESWQDAGVALKVELQTNRGLIKLDNQQPLPFVAGGPNGIPQGWVQVSGDATGKHSVSALGIYTQQDTNGASTNSQQAVELTFAAEQGFVYEFQVDMRLTAGKSASDTYHYLNFYEHNPSTNAKVSLGLLQDFTPADWITYVIRASRAINWAGGFRNLIIRLQSYDYAPGSGSALWGNDFAGLYVRKVESASAPTITWKDITCDVKGMDIRYGRERFTERFDVASLGLVLDNTTGEYAYAEPHPFNFGPGRAVRVTATYKGTTYPMAAGIIDACNDSQTHDGKAITTVHCVDPTTLLSLKPTPEMSYAPALSGQRIRYLVDYSGYPLSNIANGVLQTKKITGSNRNLREECGVTADSEGGNFFAERNGELRYLDRNYKSTSDNYTKATATLLAKPSSGQPPPDAFPSVPNAPTICVSQFITDWNMSRVVNDLWLANAGSPSRHYEDETSQRENGTKSYQRTDLLLVNSSDLDIRANDYMTGNTQPKMRLNSITYRPGLDGNSWAYTLAVSLLWLVRFWYANARGKWGWEIITRVQSVEHRITATEWETTLALDEPVYYGDAPIVSGAYWDTGARWDTGWVWS